jgi:predicted AAA+ superfamily ATPase
LNQFPVTLILGPRQCGKTTLARAIATELPGIYFDLEDPETPLQPSIAKQVLEKQQGLVIIDEFQRQPELFKILRVLADRKPLPARFLVLGSASLELVKGLSESLAGRVAYFHLGGFNIAEAGVKNQSKLWLRGGFPPSFIADDDPVSYRWRKHFLQSFLERDIPQLGIRIPSATLARFWTMVAHLHGRIWNAADLARSLGTQESTARRYLDILSGAFMIRQLQPWHENVGKRLVKSPKIYIRDTGLLHSLLGIVTDMDLHRHPVLGFSWEGFALDQVISFFGDAASFYFYKTHSGAELDCLAVGNGRRTGFEFKYQDSPRTGKSMHVVRKDLRLDMLYVLYPGNRAYPLSDGIEVIPLKDLAQLSI